MLFFSKIFAICKEIVNILKAMPAIYKKGLIKIISSLFVGLLFFIIAFILFYDFNTNQILIKFTRSKFRSYYNPGDYFIMILTSFFIVGIFIALEKIYMEYKKIQEINANIDEYCNEFILNFQEQLDNIPNSEEIKEFLSLIDNKNNINLVKNILIPIILQKINIIENMDILEKYKLIYKRNIIGLNLNKISNYNLSKDNINEVLIYLNNLHKYIKFNVKFFTKKQFNLLNNCVIYNSNEAFLIMYFNQKIVLKNIILEVFLNNGENNEFIRNDIIQAINNNLMTEKEQLLINSIIENIGNNEKFKEVFIKMSRKNENILNKKIK